MSPANNTGGVGNVTFRELEFGADDLHPMGIRRSSLWLVLISIFIFVGTCGGMTLYTKKPNESIVDAGSAVFGRTRSLLDNAPWSPFRRARGKAPIVNTPKPSPELFPPDAGVADADPELVFLEENQVVIKLTGLPKESTAILGGQPMGSEASVEFSNKPIVLKVTIPGARPIIKKVVPNRDQTIAIKSSAKHRKGKKKRKYRKKTNKK
jgi:hypothetical protein